MLSAKKVLFSVFGGFLLLILIGVLIFFSLGRGKEKKGLEGALNQLIPAEDAQKLTVAEQNVVSFHDALAAEDESLCHGIQNATLRSECFDRVRLASALRLVEIDLCTAISDSKTKIYCSDNVLLKKAVQDSNAALCAEISHPTLQQKCRQDALAEALFSAETAADCRQIPDAAMRQSCLENLLFAEISAQPDNSFCNKFTTSAGRQKCNDYFLNRNALAQKDPTLCLKIILPETRSACEAALKTVLKKEDMASGVLQGKSEYCADFSDLELRTQCEDEANYYAAKIYRQTSYCEKIKNAPFAERCRKDLTAFNDDYWLRKSQSERNKDYCAKISAPASREYCQKLS